MIIVAPADLATVWPRIEHWISAAIEEGQGDENALDVLIALARGHYLLWYEEDHFAAVVQIVNHPRQRVATIVYLGASSLDELPRAFHEGTLWARANGISVIRTHGRPGWERIEGLGLKRIGVILQARV